MQIFYETDIRLQTVSYDAKYVVRTKAISVKEHKEISRSILTTLGLPCTFIDSVSCGLLGVGS
jgi:hypothetical protein